MVQHLELMPVIASPILDNLWCKQAEAKKVVFAASSSRFHMDPSTYQLNRVDTGATSVAQIKKSFSILVGSFGSHRDRQGKRGKADKLCGYTSRLETIQCSRERDVYFYASSLFSLVMVVEQKVFNGWTVLSAKPYRGFWLYWPDPLFWSRSKPTVALFSLDDTEQQCYCAELCCTVLCALSNAKWTLYSGQCVKHTIGQYKASAALTMPVIRQIVAACPSLHLSTNLGSAIHSSCVLPSNIVLCTWAVRCCTGVQLNLYWAALHRSVGRMSRPEWHKGDISSTTLHQETL